MITLIVWAHWTQIDKVNVRSRLGGAAQNSDPRKDWKTKSFLPLAFYERAKFIIAFDARFGKILTIY